ncbi:MAG: spore coat U domain-containing protein [Gallionellaceae bacterium]|nr:spore coat U domain-containing protein [Gallionellaceae bacterium]
MKRLTAIALAALLLALPQAASALCLICSCSVAVNSNVAFGTYNPLPGAAADAAGHFTVTCDLTLGLLGTYTVALATGGGNSYSPRKMNSGTNTLNYNLYTDAARTAVWGNGTGGSTIVSDASLLTLLGHVVRAYDVYGRILPNQQATRPGSYSDTILVTVTYN